jgi:hypothetical protein
MMEFCRMKPMILFLTLAGVAGCAVPESGIRNPAEFEARAVRSEVPSRRPAPEVARCFEQTAVLLPYSTVTADVDGKGATYRLRGLGQSFEEIRFRSDGRGSVAEVLVAPGLDAGWQTGLERDRLGPLRLCAAG